ncbi:MAG: dTMP kinase [Alistipes sp.]|nr:dTMP kinase [Candidatus Minthomonas equi]
MLIVIEGLDGSGKSTQVRKVREYLSEKVDGTLRYVHFPRYEAPLYGDLISRFLRGDFGSIEQVHPMLVALLFAQDRHDASEQICNWLKAGDTVLLDRYVYSNIAYQCAKLDDSARAEELREWIFHTEYTVFGVPKPDLNVFLDVPISFVDEKLKENRDGDDRDYLQGKADIHEADIEFQKKVRNIYLRQTELDSEFIRVDCSDCHGNMLAPELIFDKLKEVLE